MSPIHNNHSSTMYEPPVIDLENKNSSHTLLIELAGENNTILEIGTSTGYISKILKERGNTVTGIEIDPEAGELAQQHCDQVIIGDIETLDLDAHLTPSSFDVILLGDVLEHLVSPGVALRKLQPYLKPEGYLAISLPNVCHGDVILQMLRGDFKYTSMGLLDVTHLRFFGLRNIIDLMARSGYAIHLIQTTTHYVGGTELRIDHTTLPEDLINFLKSIPNSTVYQFIIKAELLKPWDRIDPVPEPDLAALFNEAIAGRIHEEKLPLIQELQGYKSQISGLHEAVNSLEQVVNERDYKLNESSNKLMQLSYELNNMKKSLVWRFLMKFHYGVVERIFPGNSRRRNCYELGLQGGRIIADDGFRSFLKQTSFYLQSTKEMGFENKSNCEFQYSMPEYKFCACKELNKPESTFSGFIRGRGIYIGIDNIPFSIPANTKLISINLEDRDFNDIFEKINQGESLDFCIFSDLIDAKNVPAYREYLKLLKTGGMLIILNKNHTPSFSIEMIHSLFEDTYTLIKEDFYTPNFEKTNGESNEKIQQTNNRSFKAYIIEKTNYIDRITEILQESNTWEDSNLNSLDIIIPVYNAYNDLLRCLYSIVVHQNNYRIILINDCSTDERIGDLFQKLNSLQSGKLTLLENKENLGFVKTVNIGMKHSINDVILLNSDTIVTRGWAEKMLRCAYSNPLIGTVTPFTNNGTICSVPNFCTENDIPAGFTIDNFARYIEEVSLQHYPTIPTAVGFCMYIKRDVLDKIGYFDEESFGKGYGEENDFCMRAKNKGYIHALCDDTFVFHKGEASFSEQKNELIHKNLATLTVKYPEYLPIVHSFINLNPLQELHLNIQKRITTWDQHGEKKRILYILHTWGGGTEKHVKDLINALHDTYVFFVLQVEERCLVL
ncbi:methyltransferase domain-containing protein, partial [Methanosalsum natronophilum]